MGPEPVFSIVMERGHRAFASLRRTDRARLPRARCKTARRRRLKRRETTQPRLLPRPMLRRLYLVHCLRTVRQVAIYRGVIRTQLSARLMALLFPPRKLISRQ